jgi:glutathione S-transferase
MKLYNLPLSHFASRCRIALREKGLTDVEIVRPPGDGPASAEYRRVNPLGKVPALDVGGRVIVESEVINEYLEDRFPEPPLLPRDAEGRARARTLSRFHDLYLEPAVHPLFFQLDPKTRDPQVVATQLPETATRLDQLEALLVGPWAAGPAFTLADCALAPTMLFVAMVLPMLDAPSPLEGRPRLAAWWAVVQERPSVRAVHDEQRAAVLAEIGR